MNNILVLFPWQADADMVAYAREFVPADIDVTGLKQGCVTGNRSGMAYLVPNLLDTIIDAERQGYKAVVLVCHSDPGVQEARELVDIPVIGPTMVALHISLMLGHKVCILQPSLGGRLLTYQNVILYGFENRVVVRAINSSGTEADQAYKEYKVSKGKITGFTADILAECLKAIEEDGVDTITFGCGSIMWMKEIIQSELAKKGYKPTVVNPLPTAVEIARSLVNLRLTHSRLIYPKA